MDLAGVSTYDPAMRDAPEQKQVDAEAMQAAEKDLLGRELTVLVEGKSDKGFMATIQSGDRVYQEEMVKKGWARVIGQCSFSTRLAEAEAQAKSKKIGRWVKYEPKPEEKKLQEEKQKKASGGGVTFSGQIMQIIDPCFVAGWGMRTRSARRSLTSLVCAAGWRSRVTGGRSGCSRAGRRRLRATSTRTTSGRLRSTSGSSLRGRRPR
eukprot:Sspe_Gene.30327::Locus_14992_Transcript_2_2_Confidence_0.667_Length_1422::g.30327::m.30327